MVYKQHHVKERKKERKASDKNRLDFKFQPYDLKQII